MKIYRLFFILPFMVCLSCQNIKDDEKPDSIEYVEIIEDIEIEDVKGIENNKEIEIVEIDKETEIVDDIMDVSEETNPLKGTEWKLAGFVDKEKGTLKVPEPKDCINCYMLKFGTDTIWGVTSWNLFRADCKINYEAHSIHIFSYEGDLAGEQGDGWIYRDALFSVQFFSFRKNELRLYYNNKKKYLLFIQNY